MNNLCEICITFEVSRLLHELLPTFQRMYCILIDKSKSSEFKCNSCAHYFNIFYKKF